MAMRTSTTTVDTTMMKMLMMSTRSRSRRGRDSIRYASKSSCSGIYSDTAHTYQVTNDAADAGPAMDAKGKRRARSPYYEYHYPSSLGTTILSVDEHPITPPHLPFIYPAREPCVVIGTGLIPSRSWRYTHQRTRRRSRLRPISVRVLHRLVRAAVTRAVLSLLNGTIHQRRCNS